MRHLLRGVVLVAVLGLGGVPTAHAIEVKVSALALERTLRKQLFNGPDGRYYMRGDATTACYVYAENPHVSFKDDRVLVHVHTRARIGTALRGACIGVSLTTDADVSLVPEAEGESVGFRDARIERLSESKELNFLSGAVPEPQAAVADEGERRRSDEQPVEPVGGDDGIRAVAGLSQASFDAGGTQCAGGGC